MNALLRIASASPPAKYATTILGSTTRGNVSFPGGLDQLTPSQALHPGALRDGLNFECSLTGGYSRIGGYERTDGHTSPSDATFVIVQVTSFTTVPAVGQQITQAGSGATGVVAAVNNEPGAYYMVLTRTTGTFDSSGAISVEGLTVTAANSPYTVTAANSPVTITAFAIGTATTTTVSLTAQETAQYTNAAADIYRAEIDVVPGSGSILGVLTMAFDGGDCLYAWRANAAGTAVDIWKATTMGWVNVPFYKIVEFTSGGTAIPAVGQSLTQGAVTATIKRVMQRSGSITWAGTTAAGAFIIDTPLGGNFTAGAATVSTSGATVTLSGAETDISMLPGGHIEWGKGNFGGQLSTRRAYGADGVNKCFDFDGDILAPITTGLTTDTPDHIAFHNNFLFASKDASVSHCGAGTPYRWSSTDGGGEIAVGDTVTAMISMPGNQTSPALAVFQSDRTAILYGSDPDPTTGDFKLVSFTDSSGARPYSAQAMFDTFVFDELGVVGITTTLNFGNFLPNTVTRNMMPFIQQRRTLVAASSVSHTKGQYRVFFTDGSALYLTFAGQQFLGAIPQLFPDPVTCIDDSTTVDGDEVCYFGSSSGYVYQIDKGTSFDGESIDAYITTAWDNLRAARQMKAYRGATVEISSDTYVGFQWGYQLGYGSASISQPSARNYSSSLSGIPIWDEFTWDNFTWDGSTLEPSSIDMDGSGENVQVTISSNTDYIAPYTINAFTYRYSMRRGMREG